MEKETVQGKTEKTVGHVKQAAGDLSGDSHLEAEGLKDQLKGQLHETVGAIKQAGKDISAGSKDGAAAAKNNE